MISDTLVTEIILQAFDEVNQGRIEDDGPEATLLPESLDVTLSGDGAEVDSLELITIMTVIEECLEAEGYDLDLTDDAATAAVPWETGETLLAYICERLA